MKTLLEIINIIEPNGELINTDQAMEIAQEYSDRQTANLKAINDKQAELIEHFKKRPTIGGPSALWIIWNNKTDQLESELQSLQSGKEIIEININDPELNEPI